LLAVKSQFKHSESVKRATATVAIQETAQMSTTAKPILEVDLENNPGKVCFYDVDEAEKWIDHEQGYWRWAWESGTEGVNLNSWLKARFDRLKNDLETLRKDRNAHNLSQQLNTLYRRRELLHSSTPEAKNIEVLRETDRNRAAYALVGLLHDDLPIGVDNEPASLKPCVRGIFDAQAFKTSFLGNAEAEKRSFNEVMRKVGEIGEQFKSQLESVKTQWSELSLQIDGRLNEQDQQWSKFVSSAKEEWKGITTQYRDSMALRAPVEYWRAKADEHKSRAQWRGRVSLGVGVVLVAALVAAVRWVYPEQPTGLQVPAIALLGILSTGAIWLERVLVRVYLSHVHLETDAAERVVMIQTYLAMLEDERQVSPEHRVIVVQQIFRHTPTGVVRDDSAPPTPLATLTNISR
jgi:hypothetical protein